MEEKTAVPPGDESRLAFDGGTTEGEAFFAWFFPFVALPILAILLVAVVYRDKRRRQAMVRERFKPASGR